MANYILLSGGSGKRLWPLSNNSRSKQFLKLLQKENGTFESMVQRVIRQIKTVDDNAKITIATSFNQVQILKKQLGNDVDISIEPSRRDTFPAIVLACQYLIEKKNLSLDEPVVVCPVDPYVDIDYFSSILELNNIIKERNYNIGLLGIKPTYPSEKYGYIIPKSGEKFAEIKEFKEKPNVYQAENYIKEGGLWNGGVFCFKLKYLSEKAHELIDFKDYDDLLLKYDCLTKISFDYAILEKENRLGVLRYSGEWKDIGTWNTLTEVMNEKTIGDCLLDDKSKNTSIINELNIPIIGMGLNNIIIAASPDGIFVSDKDESSYNKKLVEKVDNRPMYEERLWGDYKILDVYKNSLVKHICVKAGEKLSYQKHNHRNEIWNIIDGSGIFVLDGVEKSVQSGDILTILKGQKHSIRAIKDLHFIEIQSGDELSEEDIERFEYDWKRME